MPGFAYSQRSRHRTGRVIVALLLASASLPVSAQVTGRISGFVKDPAGAAIPSVAVTARMTEQQSTGTARTNAEGFYDILALPPGDYEIVFEAAGFRRQVRSGIELTINQNLRVDASLEVGSVETSVTVTGTAPLVDTVSPVLSGLIDDRRVVDLPLNGRNIMSLAGILPGVLAVAVPQEMDNARSGPIMDVNGGRSNMNLFTFNGGYFNNPSRNTGIDYPPPDAIEEVRILTHDFSAEYGHNPGSQVLVASKTGTNQIHGAAWEFLRNNDFNARNFFAPTVPVVHQDQFGAAAGGPIRKDKLFIFGTYQGLINHQQAQSVQSLLPSAAQRSGDFTALKTTLADPADPLTNKPLLDPVTGAPCVAGNKIAAGCLSPAAAKLLSFVPITPNNTLVTLAAKSDTGRHGDDARGLESKLQASHLRIVLSRSQQSLQPARGEQHPGQFHVGEFYRIDRRDRRQRCLYHQPHAPESGHLYMEPHQFVGVRKTRRSILYCRLRNQPADIPAVGLNRR